MPSKLSLAGLQNPIRRSLSVFLTGILFGAFIHTALGQGGGRIAVNHVAVNVENLDDAVKFFTQTMGFREAFTSRDDKGQPILVYVQANRDTFIELQPATAQNPPGLNHIGLEVEDLRGYIARLKEHGVKTEEPRVGRSKAILSNTTGPGGARIELLEFPPDSVQRKAIQSWR